MGVKIDDEWRFKRIKSERASKSAFAFKINSKLKLKEQSKASYGFLVKAPYSREVIIKITGGARSKKGIKNTTEYISKGWQEEIIDSNGIKYKTGEEMGNAVGILQENVIANRMREEKLTHNMVFSAPKIAGVKKEDTLEAVRNILKEKYPDNYFIMAYHNETKNSHVHVVLNIHRDTGERINIRKKDLRDIREGFCQNLIECGYDVKATRKYGYKLKEYEELVSQENKNIYEVVDFGTASYQLDKKNDKNSYLIYKTANDKEVTIWGKELLDNVVSKNIKKGDLIKIKKMGYVDIKVPVYGRDKAGIISWKVARRNHWNIEKAEVTIDSKLSLNHDTKTKQNIDNNSKEIKLDSTEQKIKQLGQRQKFEQEKKLSLDPEYRREFEFKQKREQEIKNKRKFGW